MQGKGNTGTLITDVNRISEASDTRAIDRGCVMRWSRVANGQAGFLGQRRLPQLRNGLALDVPQMTRTHTIVTRLGLGHTMTLLTYHKFRDSNNICAKCRPLPPMLDCDFHMIQVFLLNCRAF